MAVDDISKTNPVLASALLNQGRSITQQASSLETLVPPAPPAIAPDQDIATARQNAALGVNEALNELNFVAPTPGEALLINEIPPATALLLENTELTPVQQAALAVNEALTGLAATPETRTAAQATAQNAQESAQINVTAEATAAATATEATTATATVQPAATTTTAATETVTTPGQQIIVQPVQDRNVIATPVYEIRDQKPPEPEPKPRAREVFPPPPIARVRPVDPLVLRQEWERRRENRRREESGPRQPLAERAIREMIATANADLAANGLPLRLVLAKNEAGYSIDVYDCSYDEACRLSQEVRLDLSQLVTILENLHHETGIIVNIIT